MNLGYRSDEYQTTLFDAPLRAAGSMRNVCGEFVELCTRKLTGAKRLKTSSKIRCCPDLHFEDNIWFECKSIGKTGYSILYRHRLEKETEFVRSGNRLYYWLWHHAGRIGEQQTAADIRRAVAASLRAVYVVRHDDLAGLLSGVPVCLNSMYYSNHGPNGIHKGDGWKIPIRGLRAATGYIGQTPKMHVRGVFVRSIPVYSSCFGGDWGFVE